MRQPLAKRLHGLASAEDASFLRASSCASCAARSMGVRLTDEDLDIVCNANADELVLLTARSTKD